MECCQVTAEEGCQGGAQKLKGRGRRGRRRKKDQESNRSRSGCRHQV